MIISANSHRRVTSLASRQYRSQCCVGAQRSLRLQQHRSEALFASSSDRGYATASTSSSTSSSNGANNDDNIRDNVETGDEARDRQHLTGAAKLFADALAEESLDSSSASDRSATIGGTGTRNRDHLKLTQGPIWTGDESQSDAVLRMLVDAHKPLRSEGGIKHNASEEKIKGIIKNITGAGNFEPRLGRFVPLATAEQAGLQKNEGEGEGEGEEIKVNPHRTTIPPHLHRPWHSTYTGSSRTAMEDEVPKVKYGTFIKSRKAGEELTNLLELNINLPKGGGPIDGKTRSKIREARKSGRMVRRLDNAREGALDYKLGLGNPDEESRYVQVGVDGEEGGDDNNTFRGNRQIRGASVLGAQKGGASGLRAWGGLVEDRIQRAKEAGFFKVTNGKGKPIPRDPEASNPHLETGELLMNRIVKRQGALPPWIELQHSLDATMSAFRSTLLTTYTTHLVRNVISTNALSPLPPLHSIPSQDDAWEAREFKFHQENVKQINDLIRRMNAQAPSPARRNLITLESELGKLRGDVLKNEVWNEVKRRAEEAAKISQRPNSSLPPFIFDNEGWNALKSATKRSFGTIAAPVTAVIGKGRVGGTAVPPREMSPMSHEGAGGRSSSSGGNNAGNPKPLRLAVMGCVGIGAIVYFSRRPVHNDSTPEFDVIPLAEQESEPDAEQIGIVASSPSEPPLTPLRVIRLYIFEPLATFFRFLHLALLFGPVILTTPMLLVGKPERRRRTGKPIKEEEENWGAVWWYSFLVRQMERAGPSFIKLGQWAASRADLFPASLCDKMSKLHSNGKPHSIHHTRRVMEKAFGMKFDDIFEEFGDEPIGCGAIAQVYKATLKPSVFSGGAASSSRELQHIGTDSSEPSNTAVAIKVLHPRVRKTIRRDIAIMSVFANILNTLPGMEWISLPEEVQVFGEMMNSQLDLRVEASNLDRFERNFQKRGRRVTFPSPIKLGKNELGEEREETQDVLIEEFEDALPLKWFLLNGGGPYDDKIASIGLDAFLEMLLLDNWTHGDLHPGNIMVRFYKPTTTDYIGPLLNKFSHHPQTPPSHGPPSESVTTQELVHSLSSIAENHDAWHARLEELNAEGYEPQLIFIDAGLVTSLDGTNRRNFLDLFQAVAEFDGYKAGKLMVERCRTPEYCIDEETFALKMQHIVLSVKSKTFSLAKIKISDILTEVLTAIRTHHVKLEGDFINTVLSILLLEGIGRQLDPDMDLFKSALPILRQLGRQMGTKEAISHTPKGNLLAMVKLWVWVEARQVAGEASAIDQWIKYDRLFPAI
ncbi:Atypical/ABC1/ABC1-C protein kinase [Kwoniella heveanensis BCC8398]|uniref:Atypical/ABC1/ABC1-C protein kinase n=1 Tax=Kwoniella heveanensis BCC8398 TaxID=1296120 RepID=A0A1B9GUN9_9TREE|nr:Atypical/ABC1/ABC1-C protein kinase [Kwoniella heveanensis BCC8398]